MPVVAGYDPHPSDHVGVEVAFATQPDDPSPAWVDLTSRLDLTAGVTITRGRADEFSQVQPSTCSLTLDNADGALTAGNSGSVYYPNVLPYREIRVFYTDPNTGVRAYRFTGYVEEWPVEWVNGQAYAQAQITAVDRLARVGSHRAMRSVIEESILADRPFLYFPLGEPEGSTGAGEASVTTGVVPASIVQIGSGGTLTFGTATGPPTDSLPAPTFTPASQFNGLFLRSDGIPNYGPGAQLGGSSAMTLRANFLTSAVQQQQIMQLRNQYGYRLELMTNSTGQVVLREWDPFTGFSLPVTSITSSTSFNDGATHDVSVVGQVSAGTLTWTVRLDGVSIGSASRSAATITLYDEINVGGYLGGLLFTGVIAHVAAFPSALTTARLDEHYLSTKTGFDGETSDARIARYASWAGISTADMVMDTGSSTVCFTDTTGQSVLAAMQDVAQTENGRLFMDGAGKLTFQSRARTYENPAAAASVDAHLLGPDTRFSLSTQGVVNDSTGQRPNGPDVRATDQTSIAAHGVLSESRTLLLTSDAAVADAVHWRVATSANPQVRSPSATFDLYTDTTGYQAQLRGLELGDRVTVTGLPAQAPASSMDFVLEGYSETIGLTGWSLTANLSNYSSVQALVLDDATYGLLDSSNRLIF